MYGCLSALVTKCLFPVWPLHTVSVYKPLSEIKKNGALFLSRYSKHHVVWTFVGCPSSNLLSYKLALRSEPSYLAKRYHLVTKSSTRSRVSIVTRSGGELVNVTQCYHAIAAAAAAIKSFSVSVSLSRALPSRTCHASATDERREISSVHTTSYAATGDSKKNGAVILFFASLCCHAVCQVRTAVKWFTAVPTASTPPRYRDACSSAQNDPNCMLCDVHAAVRNLTTAGKDWTIKRENQPVGGKINDPEPLIVEGFCSVYFGRVCARIGHSIVSSEVIIAYRYTEVEMK